MKDRAVKTLSLLLVLSLFITGCGFTPFYVARAERKEKEESSKVEKEKDPDDDPEIEDGNDPHAWGDAYDDLADDEEYYIPTDGEIKDDPEEAFKAYTDSIFLHDISYNTINLHYTIAYPENYGIDDYDVTLGDFSIDQYEENKKELKNLAVQLDRYNRAELSYEQQIAYDVLMDYVETEKEVEDKELYLLYEPLSSAEGEQIVLPIILAGYTFRRERDVKDYLILLSDIDRCFDGIMDFEKAKADAGLFMSDDALDRTIDQCEQFIEKPEENYMIASFDERLDAVDWLTDKEKEDYKKENKELILNEVIPAYEELIDELEEYRGTGTNYGGICYFDEGTTYYEYLIKANVGTDASVRQLEDRLEDYISERMSKIVATLSTNESLYDKYRHFSFDMKDPEEIMPDLIEKCKKDFPEPPDVNYDIKSVDPSLEDHSSPAYYLQPPIDDKSENSIYINWSSVDRNRLYSTLAHEGYPGHLYEAVFASNYDRPLIRNAFSWGGYTEGWATYTEFYSYGLGIDDLELANIMMWDRSTTLAIYALMDMRIHYDGWTEDNVRDYISQFYGDASKEAAKEMYGYIIDDPAGYLDYCDGYLEFVNLRNKAKKDWGDKYSLKQFHQFVMDMGPLPFYMMEDHMDEWIDRH